MFFCSTRGSCLFSQSWEPGNHKPVDELLLGIFGDIHNGTADLGVSPVSITQKRFQNFSFIDSFLRRTYVAVIHENRLNSASPATAGLLSQLVTSLFHREVWIGLCCVFYGMIGVATVFQLWETRCSSNSPRTLMEVFWEQHFRILGMGLGIEGIGRNY